MIDLTIHPQRLARTLQRARQQKIIIPTFKQQRQPQLIPPAITERLRTVGLKGTKLATATAGTIRTQLLKIGAIVKVSTRRVYVQLASAFPMREVFFQAHQALSKFSPS